MTEPFQQSTETTLELEKWQQLHSGLKAGFTTRNGGMSAPPYDTLNMGFHSLDDADDITANRQKLADIIHFPMKDWVSGEQTHQTNVQFVTGDDKAKASTQFTTPLKKTDGLITNRAGILCTALFADCVPIYFFAPSSGYVGIAHAGWRGTVQKIGQQMIDALQLAGADPADILVAIGPSISQEVYEVDKQVISHIPDEFVDMTVVPKENNRFLLDLRQLNAEILLQQGVLSHNIEITNYCTFRDEDLFFSHRRDQGSTGRMLGYIGFKTGEDEGI